MFFRTLLLSTLLVASCVAQITIPGGVLNVPANSAAGTSFNYTGTLTQAATITFTQTGNPCLQYGEPLYCVNGAGVIVSGGTVGSSSPVGSYLYGALLMEISGVGTVQVFPANSANGAGSATPPASLTLAPTSLSALGFGAFSVNNPTITFRVADSDWSDNTNAFILTQAGGPPAVPVPGSILLSVLGLAGTSAVYYGRRLRAKRQS